MIKNSLLILAIIFTFNAFTSEIYFSCLNEFNYILADRIIENRNYFSDKLTLQVMYRQFRLGLKYDLYRPRFNRFALINEEMTANAIKTMLKSEKDENFLDEYYLQYESDHWFIQAGTFEAAVGSGMILHNFYNEDFEEDSRLTGAYFNPVYDKWQLQLFGGWMKSDDANLEDEYDRLGAVDASFNISDNLSLSTAYVLHQKLLKIDEIDYLNRVVISGRLNFTSDKIDLQAEYANGKDDNEIESSALYATATGYLGKFTLSSSYKNYENFDVRISDLPMVNHIGQQLAHGWDPGRDEEGFMGEIKFLPNYDNEFVLNYAEGWSSNYKVRLSNFYAEYKRDFDTFSLKTEFEVLEQLNEEDANYWYKEITPALTLDFMIDKLPVLIKAEYQYKEKENISAHHSHFEPRLQSDVSLGNYSLSLAVENQIGDSEAPEDGDDGDFWIGAEIAATVLKNTDIRLFYGKEKGGVVCRNGVCKNQSEFSGLRLMMTTTF
jgi:hypothetical protein